MSAEQAAAAPSSVAGYVEALTATAALGWVWLPGRDDRLAVELRLGAAVVAEAIADEMREDLARGGIGDGRHAFTLPIPEALRSRLGELRVFACPEAGSAVPLGAPPRQDGVAERLVQLQRGVEMIIGSQRLLHRNLQAALLKQTPEDTATLADIAATQAALQEGIATLELFVARLEQGSAAQPAAAATTRQPRLALAGVAAISLLALIASSVALVRALPI